MKRWIVISIYWTLWKEFKKCCPYIDSLMSGSPIIQDEKLAGAVPHVFLQDSTRGYGILIENMLEH